MSNKDQNTFLEYFSYFRKLLGKKLYVLIIYDSLIGLFDGLSLVMFIPLIGVASGTEDITDVGKLQFLIDGFTHLGVSITLKNVLFLMIIFFGIKSLLIYMASLYSIKVRQHTVRKMRFSLVEKMHAFSYRGYVKSDSGTLQHAMITESRRLVESTGQFTIFIQGVIILLIYFVLALLANWQFALLIIGIGVLTNIIFSTINRAILKRARGLSKLSIRYNKYLIQIIQNFKYLKATDVYSKYKSNLKNVITKNHDQVFQIGRLNNIVTAIQEPIVVLTIATVILVYVNGFGQTFGSIIISLILFYRSMNYLLNCQAAWNKFLEKSVSIQVVEDLISFFDKNSEQDSNAKTSLETISTITLKGVHLQYDDVSILKGINLTIQKRSTIAIVGESGAGKTTLANVISGLVQPNEGKLLYNDCNIEKIDLRSLRKKIGYIIQEPVIFNDTIFNNVTLWEDKTAENLKRFNKSIAMAYLDNFVDTLKLKEDAMLGENGLMVSGGQKQRIAIARELYKDVDLIIMDEATSALDVETEHIVKSNIEQLSGKYTLVIIAHRLSTIKNADEINVLSNGTIIDRGSYHELYERSSTFRQMMDTQET